MLSANTGLKISNLTEIKAGSKIAGNVQCRSPKDRQMFLEEMEQGIRNLVKKRRRQRIYKNIIIDYTMSN